jgi:hypothetical protein
MSAQRQVGKTLKLCKNKARTGAGLTHTTDSNSTLDRCQQAGTNLFGGHSIINASLLQTVQNPLHPIFPDCPTGAHLGGV